MLPNLNWMEHQYEATISSLSIFEYIKVFTIDNRKIPVNVRFKKISKDGYPTAAFFKVIDKAEINMNYSNIFTIISGRDRIICFLDQAGLLTALKYLIFSKKSSSWSQKSKQIIYDYAAIV